MLRSDAVKLLCGSTNNIVVQSRAISIEKSNDNQNQSETQRGCPASKTSILPASHCLFTDATQFNAYSATAASLIGHMRLVIHLASTWSNMHIMLLVFQSVRRCLWKTGFKGAWRSRRKKMSSWKPTLQLLLLSSKQRTCIWREKQDAQGS